VILNALRRFVLVCVGGGLFAIGFGLTITGIGAIFGIPMMALGWGLIEINSESPDSR
jgi:hypothetical protein